MVYRRCFCYSVTNLELGLFNLFYNKNSNLSVKIDSSSVSERETWIVNDLDSKKYEAFTKVAKNRGF
jgi:hypothetical protein